MDELDERAELERLYDAHDDLYEEGFRDGMEKMKSLVKDKIERAAHGEWRLHLNQLYELIDEIK